LPLRRGYRVARKARRSSRPATDIFVAARWTPAGCIAATAAERFSARARDDGRAEQLVCRHGLRTDGHSLLLEAGDEQQVVGERDQPVGLFCGGPDRGFEFLPGAGLSEREVELGAQQRERRAQLVTGLGDEQAFVLERRLEPPEHVVQRLGEARDLVPTARDRKPAPPASRRRSPRPSSASLPRPERRTSKHITGECRDEQRQR